MVTPFSTPEHRQPLTVLPSLSLALKPVEKLSFSSQQKAFYPVFTTSV